MPDIPTPPFEPDNLEALLTELPADSLAAKLVTAVQYAADQQTAVSRITAVIDALLAAERERLNASAARA
jgi:hypothetical protein